MTARTFLSPAKVNLFLYVIGKRPDGFHEIRTLMQPLSLCDEIAVTVERDGRAVSLVCEGRYRAPTGPENLAWRAAELFMDHTGRERSVRIAIKKRIPVGAGLGGGSSNAATVLKALNFLSGAPLGRKELRRLGARLGSDVPFFVGDSPALATGRGEILEPCRLPGYAYLLINPGFHVSTAHIYGRCAAGRSGRGPDRDAVSALVDAPHGIASMLHNDLEEATMAEHPELARYKTLLSEHGARWGTLMSGSGPTVFGIFQDRESRDAAALALRGELGDHGRVIAAEGLGGPF
ncbi:MAG TPA: 4-(cytidine 5'-diphospho)-2-C-methyl-D-erythritol kinase [Deltaproteobacteria bacterium]|nr:4-(cytidine 5'-diphospho)-2-C-methyl-D-erythritol kinase [Deltaproteobacteria bacterium]